MYALYALYVGYGFWCHCAACDITPEEVEAEDALRQEALQLAEVTEDGSGALARADRLLELRSHLGYKAVHQLEAVDAVFSLALLAGRLDRATAAAATAVQLATVREGEGETVKMWRERSRDPVRAIMG